MNDTVQFDVKQYWRLVVSRRYLFIAVSMLCLSIIVWGSYLLPDVYEAQSTVFIERNIIDKFVKNITVTPDIEDRIRVMSYTMTSRNLLMKVIDELEFNVNKENPAELEKLVKDLQEKTVIKMVNKGGKGTDWFSVTYRNKNPKLARDYVNTLVRRFVEENTSAKRDESYEANRFIGDQRKYFKDKLDAIEEKIMNFRRSKDIFVAVDEASIVGAIKSAQENLESIKTQKAESEAKKSLIEKQLKEEKPYTVAMMGRLKGDSVNDRLLMLQNKLNELLVKYTENYPEVIKVKAEIETLNRQLQNKSSNSDTEGVQGGSTEMTTLNPLHQKLKEELGNITVELAALSAKERNVNAIIESKKEYLRNIPVEKKNLADFERERDSYKKIDEELVLKLGQSEVSKQMEIQDKTENFRIVDPAILPTKPESPNRVLMILFGIVAGIASGFGVVLLLDNIDHSIKTVDELKTLLKAPVLAVIPRIITDEEINKEKIIDRKVYAVSVAYLSVIGILFIKEVVKRFL
ncbi:MAG: chain length-determining protein [Nitrospirae bacterium]|nr:chain length-determining protein [Nitrospirota bacterium]